MTGQHTHQVERDADTGLLVCACGNAYTDADWQRVLTRREVVNRYRRTARARPRLAAYWRRWRAANREAYNQYQREYQRARRARAA